jgi:serine/threonine protein kinase
MSAQAFGSYQLIKKLATGGMAEVWLAKKTGIEGFERYLVVKRILPHLAEDPEFVQMFLNEAKIASRFNHPNIAQIYDLGETDGQYFIAMEFIQGEDLGRVMRRAWSTGQWIARHISLRMVADACAGLFYAHTRNDEQGRPLRVVHRDISPQNILISFDGSVKLVDFGIAKAADQVSMTKSGAIKGKFAYMAPEQAAGKPLDARSDIFALGLVLYELVTGVRPLKRDSELATLQAALECKIDPPSMVAEIPGELDDIVMRALAKEPDDRYADAREFQRALEQHLLNSKELATSVEVSELMAALFADRVAEEARLGAPSPSTESSTSNPIPPSYSSAPQSVTQPPPPEDRPLTRARPSLTLDEEDPGDTGDDPGATGDEDQGPNVGGYELPAGTVVPSRRYIKGEATVAARASSRHDVTRAAPEESPPRAPSRGLKKRTSGSLAAPDEEAPPPEPKRRSTGSLKKRTSTGAAMPEAPPRRSKSAMEAASGASSAPRASNDGISKIVDVAALRERQKSRLKALVSVLLLAGVVVMLFVYKDEVLRVLNSGGVSAAAGVPIRLSVKTNPRTQVTVVPPESAVGRKPLDLGYSPLDEQSGAFVGDTILLTNGDRGIHYEKKIDFGEPNQLVLITMTFKESILRVKTKPVLKGASVWRGNFKVGQVGVNMEVFPGLQQLEIRADQLAEPVPFEVEIPEGGKNVEQVVDVTSALAGKKGAQ